MIKWVLERVAGGGAAVDTPIGRVAAPGGLDLSGLDLDDATVVELLRVDADGWRAEVPLIEDHYARLGDTVPGELRDELRELEKRLAG